MTTTDYPALSLRPWAWERLGLNDRAALNARATEMGVTVGVIYSSRHRDWGVSVWQGTERVYLRGKGPLAPIIAGALDDWEARP